MRRALFIILLIGQHFLCTAQTPAYSINLIKPETAVFGNQARPVRLVYGNSGFSIDKFQLIAPHFLLVYDGQQEIFFLVDLRNNTILDQLRLYDLKEITATPASRPTYQLVHLLKNIHMRPDRLFNLSFSFCPFEQTDDSTYFVGFFKSNETKVGSGARLSLGIRKNKLVPLIDAPAATFFSSLRANNIQVVEPNAFDAATLFRFNGNAYGNFSFLPCYSSSSARQQYTLHNMVIKMDENSGGTILARQTDESDFRMKFYLPTEQYVLEYYPFRSATSDTIFVRDYTFTVARRWSVQQLMNNRFPDEQLKGLRFYTDPETGRLALIKACISADTTYQYAYQVDQVLALGKEPELREICHIKSNKELQFEQLFQDQLYFTHLNPLSNSKYLYNYQLNLNSDSINRTVYLNFIEARNIHALHNQGLLDVYNQELLRFEPLPGRLEKTLLKGQTIHLKDPGQGSAEVLVQNIYTLIEAGAFEQILRQYSVIEHHGRMSLDILLNEGLLSDTSGYINESFVEQLKMDWPRFVSGLQPYIFDDRGNEIILQSSRGLYYRLVRIGRKWYLSASILSTVTPVEGSERRAFQARFRHLSYCGNDNRVIYRESKKDMDTALYVSTLPDSIRVKYFPGSAINLSGFPQNQPEDLIASLRRASEEHRGAYILSHLMVFPIQEILSMGMDEKYAERFDSLSIRRMENQLAEICTGIQHKDCDVQKINERVFNYTIDNEQSKLQLTFIRLAQRWYLYSVMKFRVESDF